MNTLDAVEIAKLEHDVRELYRNGPRLGGAESSELLEVIETITKGINGALEESGSVFRLALLFDKERDVTGLIVFDTVTGATTVIQVRVSRHLVWIGGKPVWLRHSAGPTALLKVILAEIKNVATATDTVCCHGHAGSFAYADYEDEIP